MSCHVTTKANGRIHSLGGFRVTWPEVERFHWEQAHKPFSLCKFWTKRKEMSSEYGYEIMDNHIFFLRLIARSIKQILGNFDTLIIRFKPCVQEVFSIMTTREICIFNICKIYYPSIHPSINFQFPPSHLAWKAQMCYILWCLLLKTHIKNETKRINVVENIRLWHFWLVSKMVIEKTWILSVHLLD